MRVPTLMFLLSGQRACIHPPVIYSKQRATTDMPTDSFNSFDTYWNYLYPWGDTHNEGARMDEDHVTGARSYPLPLTDRPCQGDIQFIVPVATGTWAAFWLNAANRWPPEIDVAEWKGTGKLSFNTFNTSSEGTALDVDYLTPDQWQSVKVEIRDENRSDVSVNFYMDGHLVTTQYARDNIGNGLRLIIDYQVEGSSGADPGPITTTSFQVRNV